jgi:hypothetical protein
MPIMNTEASRVMGREVPRLASGLVIDAQTAVALEAAESLLDLPAPRLDLEATAARGADHLADDAPGVQKSGWTIAGKAAVQPDEEEGRMRLQIGAEGMQGVAVCG